MRTILEVVIGGLILWGVMEYKTKAPTTVPVFPAAQAAESSARDPSFQEQMECTTVAERRYKEGGWKPEDGSTLYSHFNPKLDRCYAEIDVIGLKDGNYTETFFDAAEGREIGSWGLHMGGHGKAAGEITAPSGDVIMIGDSAIEFDAHVSSLYGLQK
jgi:hypothetical protein